MSDIAKTMAKMATLPEILRAATLLYQLGLSNDDGPTVVKRYMEANPDINELLKNTKL